MSNYQLLIILDKYEKLCVFGRFVSDSVICRPFCLLCSLCIYYLWDKVVVIGIILRTSKLLIVNQPTLWRTDRIVY